jgi:hypothetical protein
MMICPWNAINYCDLDILGRANAGSHQQNIAVRLCGQSIKRAVFCGLVVYSAIRFVRVDLVDSRY